MGLELLDAAATLLSAANLLALFIGVVVGVIMGALPGMTTPMAVSLALPFTFNLPPETGILLLLGVYKGGLYGGSISAIVIHTPGTPAAACTALDGYPLARQGQARKALSIALYASCIADFISNLALIFVAAPLASFALNFGPPEFFTLILFSLMIIANVSGDDLPRGIFSALLGLMLATVGLDTIYGSERFTFGSYELMGGLGFIPVLIGLFAIPQIFFDLHGRDEAPISTRTQSKGALSGAEFRRCLPSILRGSLAGVILGAIPGIGGAPAAFFSYSEARRRSKTPERFGKGALEGVAAAESGNNGVAGSTLIPLLALGVPGDVITAVILGAFMIHGLQPGPLMFEANQALIYALFLGIMCSSLYLLVVGKVAIRGFSYVTAVPKAILYPVVLVLCVYGSFAYNNSVFDIAVMFAMGAVGIAMGALRIPVAPFLIGFVLGPMFEDNFRQALLISQGDLSIFVSSPIAVIFLIMTALFLFGRPIKGGCGTVLRRVRRRLFRASNA